MKKPLLLFGAVLISVLNLNAQKSWPEKGTYAIDTLISKTSCQPLLIAAGGYYEMSNLLTENLLDYGVYGYARFRIAKLASFSAFINKGLTEYANGGGSAFSQELHANLFLKRSVIYADGKKKFGAEGNTEYSANYKYPAASFVGLTGGLINLKTFQSVRTDSTGSFGRIVQKANSTTLKDATGILQMNMQIVGAGFCFSQSSKFKGRITATLPSGNHVKRMIRKSASFDGAFEILMALNIKEGDNLLKVNADESAAYVNNYQYMDAKLKRLGWRMWFCGKINSVLSMTMQMGSRPGIKDALSDYTGPKAFKPIMQNFYFNAGIGLALGAL